ncbi:hypothetical protein PAHAL_9G227300 [Panicum hallii]|uniref:Uncharacterized protein n=1 Tax=Panicum hallii TaxID=206008 RepID=A0A2T8I275_9POAL|nr:hypothetical protein PAHAL_9G227300 [Panicum hallii]
MLFGHGLCMVDFESFSTAKKRLACTSQPTALPAESQADLPPPRHPSATASPTLPPSHPNRRKKIRSRARNPAPPPPPHARRRLLPRARDLAPLRHPCGTSRLWPPRRRPLPSPLLHLASPRSLAAGAEPPPWSSSEAGRIFRPNPALSAIGEHTSEFPSLSSPSLTRKLLCWDARDRGRLLELLAVLAIVSSPSPRTAAVASSNHPTAPPLRRRSTATSPLQPHHPPRHHAASAASTPASPRCRRRAASIQTPCRQSAW